MWVALGLKHEKEGQGKQVSFSEVGDAENEIWIKLKGVVLNIQKTGRILAQDGSESCAVMLKGDLMEWAGKMRLVKVRWWEILWRGGNYVILEIGDVDRGCSMTKEKGWM